MNERLMHKTIVDGEVGVTLGALFRYMTTHHDMTIVGVACSPSIDDAGLTIDINDDGTGIIEAVPCATKVTPGTWKSTHITGGDETPVFVAAGSVLSFDANSAAAGTVISIEITYLVGAVSA